MKAERGEGGANPRMRKNKREGTTQEARGHAYAWRVHTREVGRGSSP